jgi:hypothetical protein
VLLLADGTKKSGMHLRPHEFIFLLQSHCHPDQIKGCGVC